MRSLSPYNQGETEKTLTRPFYLVDIGGIEFYSSFNTVTYFTQTFDASYPVTVSRVNHKNNGAVSCNISIKSAALVSLVIANPIAGTTVKLYKGYGDSPAEADVLFLMTGVIESASIKDETVTFSVAGRSQSMEYSPRIFIAYPDFKYLASGSRLFHL